jgi:MFS transporter, DHA1 family, multidrug resistance protein
MALLAPNHPFLLTLIMMVYTWGVNWTQGLYFPESMDILPDKKGIAASVLTSARLLITAGTIETASYFYNASIVPLAVILLVISGMVSSLVFFYEKKQIKIKQRQAKI